MKEVAHLGLTNALVYMNSGQHELLVITVAVNQVLTAVFRPSFLSLLAPKRHQQGDCFTTLAALQGTQAVEHSCPLVEVTRKPLIVA